MDDLRLTSRVLIRMRIADGYGMSIFLNCKQDCDETGNDGTCYGEGQ